MVNNRYGKPINDGKGIEHAPRVFIEGDNVFVPKEDDDQAYAARGWYRIVDVRPQYDAATQQLVFRIWTADQQDWTVRSEYDIEPLPPPSTVQVKKYSKLKIVLFCKERGIWTTVKEYMEKIDYYDLFLNAQVFLDVDEYFKTGIKLFQQVYLEYGHTPEEYQQLVQQMCDYAFTGYETVQVPAEAQQEA